MPAITIDRLLAAYQERQRKLDELEKEHKQRCAPLKEEMGALKAAMHKLLVEQGLNSAPTAHGTAYRQRWRSAKVHDWEEALAWVRENERWDALIHQLNKTAVLEEIEAGRDVPGVSVETGWKLNVRNS